MTEQNSEPQPIDGARALQLLRDVVAERPDYVYEAGENDKCEYVRDGKPSCVVGHVLVRAGRTIERLRQDNTMRIDFLDHALGLDGSASLILSTAQDVQDQGKPWSRALEFAEDTAARLGVSA